MSTGFDLSESIGTVTPSGGSDSAVVVKSASGSGRWQRRLQRVVIAADLAVLALVNALAAVAYEPTLGVLGAVTVVVGLMGFRAWDRAVLGQGAEEFNRVLRGVAGAVVVLALVGMAVKSDAIRPWVFGVLPATALALLAGRFGVRRMLHRARRDQRCMSPVLVVGSEAGIADLAARTRRVPHHGWNVVAACTSTGTGEVAGVPVVGDLDDVARCVQQVGAEVVAVAPTPGWSPKRLHRLAWDLEGRGVELVVDPGLMEITGPRLHVAPVDGLPLLRLTEPRWGGPARMAKNLFDRAAAAVLVLLLAPVFVALAVLVKRDGGPVFYRQERIGRAGRPFRMVKFRSMVVDADTQIDTLVATNEGSGPLFKMKRDPRITAVGSMLRRYSLDELPQLFNVVGGSMSLVGPRPPLEREVVTYADDARRKLLVRPGMTGLWQVSGRSDLSWEESVRLDLRYVENWSPALDLSILWKTFNAVFRGRGAY